MYPDSVFIHIAEISLLPMEFQQIRVKTRCKIVPKHLNTYLLFSNTEKKICSKHSEVSAFWTKKALLHIVFQLSSVLH